jgi:formiminoglutamase
MDVRQYFNPLDFTMFSEKENRWKYSLGQLVEKSTGKVTFSNLHKLDVVIIGVPFENGIYVGKKTNVPNKIRNELYQLAGFQSKIHIADFGNLKAAKTQKAVQLALRDVVEYLNELGIVTVVLGGSQELSFGISQAFKNQRLFTLSCIDSVLDVKRGTESFNSLNFLSRIFNTHSNLFQFSLLAYQSHLVPLHLFSKTLGVGEHCRLGLLRDNFSLAEPMLQNTDFLSFDIAAVKHSEAPGTQSVNPNGLRSEEACQLAKYAGLSEKLSVFGLFGIDLLKDKDEMTVKLSAQIIWYFLEGQTISQYRMTQQTRNRIKYKVEVKDIEKPLVFLQCPETFRWWMEVQSVHGEKVLIACSEREYQQASDNEIPELWLKYVQKIDEFSK